MSNLLGGAATIGPINIRSDVKDKFREACKKKKTKMNQEIYEKMIATITEAFPDFVVPQDWRVMEPQQEGGDPACGGSASSQK